MSKTESLSESLQSESDLDRDITLYDDSGPCPECGVFLSQFDEEGEKHYCKRCVGTIDYEPYEGYRASVVCDCGQIMSQDKSASTPTKPVYRCNRSLCGNVREGPPCRNCPSPMTRMGYGGNGLIPHQCKQCGATRPVHTSNS